MSYPECPCYSCVVDRSVRASDDDEVCLRRLYSEDAGEARRERIKMDREQVFRRVHRCWGPARALRLRRANR